MSATRGAPPWTLPYRKGPLLSFPEGKERTPPRGGEEYLESMMKRMRSTCEAHERDPSEIEVSTMWIPEPGNDALEKYAEIGVDRVIVPIYALAEKGVSTTDQVKRFCDEIMVKLSTE